jgi:hypothetical protein
MGLGADGMPVAYEAKIACDGVWQRLFPWFYPVAVAGRPAMGAPTMRLLTRRRL